MFQEGLVHECSKDWSRDRRGVVGVPTSLKTNEESVRCE